MAQPGAAVIEHPNRDTAASRTTKTLVVALMLFSAVLLAIATAGVSDPALNSSLLGVQTVVLVPLRCC